MALGRSTVLGRVFAASPLGAVRKPIYLDLYYKRTAMGDDVLYAAKQNLKNRVTQGKERQGLRNGGRTP